MVVNRGEGDRTYCGGTHADRSDDAADRTEVRGPEIEWKGCGFERADTASREANHNPEGDGTPPRRDHGPDQQADRHADHRHECRPTRIDAVDQHPGEQGGSQAGCHLGKKVGGRLGGAETSLTEQTDLVERDSRGQGARGRYRGGDQPEEWSPHSFGARKPPRHRCAGAAGYSVIAVGLLAQVRGVVLDPPPSQGDYHHPHEDAFDGPRSPPALLTDQRGEEEGCQ